MTPSGIARCTLLCALCSSAVSQASSAIFFGSEANGYAGGGQLHVTGAPALAFNPANLNFAKQLEPYFSLSVVNLQYRFAYPGDDAITLKRTFPVAIAGLAYRPLPKLSVGFVYMPIPAFAGRFSISDLPTRKASDEAIKVDIDARGNRSGYILAVGTAYEAMSKLDFGVSASLTALGQSITASDPQTGATVYESDQKIDTRSWRLGVRYAPTPYAVVAGFYRPKGIAKTSGYQQTAASDGVLPPKNADPIPEGFGGAVEGVWGKYGMSLEFERENFSGTRNINDNETVDYYSTNNIVVGGQYNLSGTQNISGAFGYYPSYIGNGVMANRHESGEEVRGYEFGDINAMTRRVIAMGYRHEFVSGYGQGGLSYQRGSRDVPDSARGYGTYDLSLLTLTASGVYRF